MKLVKDIVSIIWKGDGHIDVRDGGTSDFIVNNRGWEKIDSEIKRLGAGTSHSGFGRTPRDTSVYMKWKAEECKNFIFNYALVVMEGYLPRRYLKGIGMLSSLLELCSRPSLTQADLQDVEKLAISYFLHFENAYYQFRETRVRLCKSTVHSILHLKESIVRCGPLVSCSQFWMERYINIVKRGLNATNLAAESLTQNAKLLESFKLFLGEPFAQSSESQGLANGNDAGNDSSSEDESGGVTKDPVSGAILSAPKNITSFTAEPFARYRLRDMLISYCRRCLGLSAADAANAVKDEQFTPYTRIEVRCGAGTNEVGSMLLRRSTKKRGDFYVAARFEKDQPLSSMTQETVYYGRVNFIMRYEFEINNRKEVRFLFVADWARDLRKNFVSQVYWSRSIGQVFGERSVEEVGIIMHGIGFVIHENSVARTKRAFFMDPHQRVHHLLESGKSSPDAVDRTLMGMQ